MKVIDHNEKVINLTNSTRTTFDTCRRKFYYGNVLNGYGIKLAGPNSEALLLGDIIHEMFATKLRGGNDHEVLKTGWELLNKAEESVVYPSERIEKNLFKARSMIPGIVEVATEMQRRIVKLGDVIEVESTRGVPVGKIQGYTVMVYGKLDVVLDIGPQHPPMVLDHKTVSSFRAQFYDRCQFDPQLTTYTLLCNHPNEDPTRVYHVAYNVFRKPALRQKKSETEGEYGLRLMEYLVETDPDEYMKLIATHRTGEDVFRLKQDLLSLASDLLEAEATNQWRQCTASCDMYSGCPYLMICSGTDDGSINYVAKTSTHEELTTESDETW